MIRSLVGVVLAGLLCFAAIPSHAAGLSFIDIPANAGEPAMRGAVWYPCATPPGIVMAGQTPLPGVQDCAVKGEHLPLVVMSHGFSGWFGGHHDTAEALADAGFVVAAINHPADSGRATDKSRMHSLSSITERPTDMKRLVDFMLGAWPNAATIDGGRVGIFGFSRGGFTGLTVIGGNLDFKAALARCPKRGDMAICDEIRQNGVPAPLTHDPRVKAAVIADPFLGAYFTAEGLKTVRVPVQLWASEQGGDGVLPDDPASVSRNLPVKPDYHVVPNSIHFAFLAPCSPGMAKAVPQICTDPEGFDRTAFHAQFNEQVVAFFRVHLGS